MNCTLYASFPNAADAEKAIAAVMDRGAQLDDLSALFPPTYGKPAESNLDLVQHAIEGISTTTPADAAKGAGKGAGIGLGLGAAVGLASLLIPGFGIVTGGGALATVLMGVGGSAAAGAVAGGVAGFLEDQGIAHRVAVDSEAAVKNGKAVVCVNCPTGGLGEFEIREIFSKYGADSMGRAEHYDSVPQES